MAAEPVSGTQTATDVPPELSADKMLIDNLFILGVLFFIFYFILIRPQQKKLKAHNAMMKTLAKGNRVLTTGGLIGTVSKFDGDDIVVIEIAPTVKVRVARGAISDILSEKAPVDAANDA